MKINELKIDEIERLSPSGFTGGKEHLSGEYSAGKTIKKLPGGSGLLYSIQNDSGDIKIRLWDPNKGEFQPTNKPQKMSWHSNREHAQRVKWWEERNARLKAEYARAPGTLIGELNLSKPYMFPLKGALRVDTITVDEDYRGVGLAKALYGIVLTIMKRPLVAGTSQTPGGRRNWVSISQIPGVEMKGYFSMDSVDLQAMDTSKLDNRYDDVSWAKAENKRIDQRIDTIMGKLGGQYIGKASGKEFFAFDVNPDTTKQELKAHVDTTLTKVYGSYDSNAGLFAVWNG